MKIKSITIFENILGVILAVFIIFKVLPDTSVARMFNEPVYIIIFLVFLVVMFLTLNPIIGILFLIYAYQILMHGKSTATHKRNQQLKTLNPEREVNLEEIIIQDSNFARIKNHHEDQTSRVMPILEKMVV
jgi:predicted membrane protein